MLGQGYSLCGDRADSQKHWERTYQLRKLHLGEADPSTLDTMWWLALAYEGDGKHDQAEAWLRKMLQVCQRTLSPENELTQKARYNLAFACKQQNKYAEAEPLFIQYAEIQRRLQGAENLQAWGALNQLGLCYREEGKYDLAVSLFVRLVQDSPRFVSWTIRLGTCCSDPCSQSWKKRSSCC